MAAVSEQQLRRDLVRLLHQGASVREYALGASRILARAIPFDGVCVLTVDPATLLPTGEVVENGLPPAAFARMAEIEFRAGDVNAFAALAHSTTGAATLSSATGGDLDRSRRHREVRGPHGFGDELRAVLAHDGTVWGALTLLRGSDQPRFAGEDAALVASLAPPLAEGLRRAQALTEPSFQNDDENADESAGIIVLDAGNAITMTNTPGQRWLAELEGTAEGDGALPPVLTAVASQARLAALEPDIVAHARVRASSGRWLSVSASALDDDGRAAVIVEPTRAHELAPLIARAYGLTDRERWVTQLVAQGHATDAIARRLHISPWTVQDHLKSIFEKAEVGTRGELVARIFFDNHAPSLDGVRRPRIRE